uniref:Uncharacterized protein n=1 Tax=Timema poppense TaxID=170557 RepID=A0A7R9DNU0_TIMPO|nr:unnamed protein product [Timema poppensis]
MFSSSGKGSQRVTQRCSITAIGEWAHQTPPLN